MLGVSTQQKARLSKNRNKGQNLLYETFTFYMC